MTLPGGGDLRTPPEDSPLWLAISRHHAASDGSRWPPQPAGQDFRLLYEDTRIAVGDCDRIRVLKHPCVWSFFEWSVFDLLDRDNRPRLSSFLEGEVGVCTMTVLSAIFQHSVLTDRDWVLFYSRGASA